MIESDLKKKKLKQKELSVTKPNNSMNQQYTWLQYAERGRGSTLNI